MKKLLSKLDKPLLVVTFICFIFGLIMILSASSMESYMRYNYSPYHYFLRHAIFLVIGFILFLLHFLRSFESQHINTGLQDISGQH